LRYTVKVGRPKEHDQRTAEALLEAAERRVAAGGLEALSVRGVAEDVGTTTRAVYSVFGSKDGMLVALGSQAWKMLGAAVAELPTTADPAADLVEAGVAAFRRFAVGHPILFSVGVQRTLASPELASRFDAARLEALAGLEAKLKRLKSARLLGRRTLRDAACEFHALCEGLAAMELRGAMTRGEEERIWRDGLTALVAGFAVAQRQSHRPARTEQ
jgi:AcrR family transcriptional regulator